MKLKHIHHEMQIRISPERMWAILSEFGSVSRFHAGVMESHKEHGSVNEASLGCERECNIVDMGLKIMLKERIVSYEEGRAYKFEVYEWKNFPLRKMLFGFTIVDASQGYTTLAIDIEYKAKPAFLTPLLAPKMKSLAQNVLLGYKHYAETGKERVPIAEIKKLHVSRNQVAAEYG